MTGRSAYTLPELLALWRAGTWVSVLLPGGAVGTPGEPGWEDCTAACVAGGPWRRVTKEEEEGDAGDHEARPE